MTFSLKDWSEPKIEALHNRLQACFEDEETFLHQACLYPISTGGKRIRPLFLFAAMEALGFSINADAMTCAAALELIHTYSLVHDDLPSMDNDDLRRGLPTVHKKYDEATAILVGDALLTKAFEIIAQIQPKYISKILKTLGHAAGSMGMIGGQALDIGMEGAVQDIAKLEKLHNRKTGALIACALEMAAILGDATEEEARNLRTYGQEIGLAFQLADDVLDEEEDAQVDGPPSFVKLLGKEETLAQAQSRLENALNAIAPLPAIALVSLAHFTVQRDH